MAHHPAVVVDGLSFTLPDGTAILSGITATFPVGRTALIGRNGSGKSTLLHLIAGRLAPTYGTIRADGIVHLVPQRPSAAGTVADLLAITPIRSALTAIEAGSTDQAHFDQVGDNWDVNARALAALGAMGISAEEDFLDRPASSVSGGEATRIALAGARLARADITLLDEPTNNLDARTRAWFADELSGWPGTVIVVSHDRELLERAGALVDLSIPGGASFTGTFSAYQEHRAAAQATAERRLREADAELARARRQAQAELQRQAQRDRSGRRERAQGNVGKMAADYFSNRAERGSGSKSMLHAQALEEAATARADADAEAREPDRIRIALPHTAVPAGKAVARLRLGSRTLRLDGPERVHLVGDNGAGKSTLLRLLLTGQAHEAAAAVLGDVEIELPPTVPTGVLGQRRDDIDAFSSALEAVRAAAPARTPHEARALLASFLIRGDRVDQDPATMSGGERFRLALARVLFADPAPQLLVLDEPSNDIDLDSTEQLIDALEDYRGALIIVTHDAHLAEALGIDTTWRLP